MSFQVPFFHSSSVYLRKRKEKEEIGVFIFKVLGGRSFLVYVGLESIELHVGAYLHC